MQKICADKFCVTIGCKRGFAYLPVLKVLSFSGATIEETISQIFRKTCIMIISRLKCLGRLYILLSSSSFPKRFFENLLELPRIVRNCLELSGMARNCPELPGILPGIAQNCPEWPGIAHNRPELPRKLQKLPEIARNLLEYCPELPIIAQESPGIARN